MEEIKVVKYPDGRLDADNAARFLGVAPKTMAIWRSAGTGPAYIKRGGRIFYYEEGLLAFIAQSPLVRNSAQAQQRDSSISLLNRVPRSRVRS